MNHLGSPILKQFKSPSSMASCLIQDSSLKSTIFSPISAFQLFNMVLGFIMQLFLSWLSVKLHRVLPKYQTPRAATHTNRSHINT